MDLDGEQAAVLAPVPAADDLAALLPDGEPDRLGRRQREIPVDIGNRETEQFFPAVAQALAGTTVEVDEAPGLIVDEEGVWRTLQKDPVPPLAGRHPVPLVSPREFSGLAYGWCIRDNGRP